MSIPPESRSTRAMEITRELFEEQKRPRFGNANPERMRLAFWEFLIEGGLPEALAGRIAEEVRANAEAAIGRACILRPS